MRSQRRNVRLTLAAMIASVLTLALAQPAHATDPQYSADCGGRAGDVNAHRYTLRDNTQMRRLNRYTSERVGVLAKNKKLHIFYKTTDENNSVMWASRAYTGGRYVCGYIYQDYIDWHRSW
jgi:hypothetical protein